MKINFFKTLHYVLLVYTGEASLFIKIIFYFTLQSEHPLKSAGVLSQSLNTCSAPYCLSLLASTSLSLPLVNFVRDSLPLDKTALLRILLPV